MKPRPGHCIEIDKCTDEEIEKFVVACVDQGADWGEWRQFPTRAFRYIGWHKKTGLYFEDEIALYGPNATLWTPEPELPELDTVWVHHSGRIYRVTRIANQNTRRPEQYPVTVVYENVENGSVWCRPASDWMRSFKPRKRTVTIDGSELPEVGTRCRYKKYTHSSVVACHIRAADGSFRAILQHPQGGWDMAKAEDITEYSAR